VIGEVTALTVASRVAVDLRRGDTIGDAFSKLLAAAGDAWPEATFDEAMATITDVICEAIELSDRPPLELPAGRA
jgi:hypothetical protein